MNTVIKLFVKYIPVVINVWILLLLLGVMNDKLYPLFGQSLIFNILLYLLSIKYKFCLWHKALIISMTTCLMIEFIEIQINYTSAILLNTKLTTIIFGLIIFTVYGTKRK